MNIVKMSVATVLALVHLMLAIPLAFLLLLLFVVFGFTYQVLIKSILVFIICFLMLELSFGFLDLVIKSIEGL